MLKFLELHPGDPGLWSLLPVLAYESMKDVSLAYGSSAFPLTIDPDRFRVVAPLEDALSAGEEHLIESPPLADLARGKRVLLIVSDLTRPTGTREFLPGILAQLGAAAVVRFLFATGLHRPLDDEDKIAIVGEDVFKAYPMLDHEPEENNTRVGTTSLGNDVEIDNQVLEHDVIVLTGSIGFHYFAGYSGGRKSLLPGVASKESIQFNHLLVLNREGIGRNPEVRVARLEGNPVHDDMVEAARMVGRQLFVYNTILDSAKKVQKTFSGHWLEAHRRGAMDYFDHHSMRLEGQRRLAIVSCGGFPRDINVIQAHKALEFAQYIVEPGGTIILLAECREGTGHSSFYPWFKYSDLDEFERQLRADYQVYGQTAYSLLSKTRRFRVICVSSLPDEQVRAMGMEPATTLDAAMALVDPDMAETGYILPFGAEVLPSVDS